MNMKIRIHIPTKQSLDEGFDTSFSPYDDTIVDVPIGTALGPFDVRLDEDGDCVGAFLMSGRVCWLLHGSRPSQLDYEKTYSFICGRMTTHQRYTNYELTDEFICHLDDYHDTTHS